MQRTSNEPRRFLFVLWDGGGNVPTQLSLARRLTERGHRVRVLAPRVLQSRIETANCLFIPFTEAPEHDSTSQTQDLSMDWAARSPIDGATRTRDRIIFGPALTYSRDVSAAIEAERPDVVLADYLLLGAYVAAERAGLPLAALVHTIFPLPAPGLPPYGMGFSPAKGPLGHARDAIFAQIFSRFYNAGLGKLNQARTECGLSPLSSVFEQFARADRLLVMTSPAFDFPGVTLPSNARYIGPQLDDPAWLTPWERPTSDDGRKPLVLVSLSTTCLRQEDLLRRIIAALADLPVQAVVTLGPSLQAGDFSLPANVQAEPYAAHVLVCPQADLVVTHGGLGTVSTALSAGVPLVCLPLARDQGDNAARVVWHGAGVRRASTASVADLRHVMRDVLEQPQYRAAAQRVAAGIAREGGPATAIAEVEQLAGSSVGVTG
jgi:MGT family glycosyltransferase